MEEMLKYEEEIKELEVKEGHLMEQLHKTIAWEQKQAIHVKESIDASFTHRS